MAKTTTLTIRISEKAKAKLEKIAKLSRRSKSWHAAEALDIYLKNELPSWRASSRPRPTAAPAKELPLRR